MASAKTPQLVDHVGDLPSGPVFYRDSGEEGVPMVFLHAASGSSLMWQHQIPPFTQAGYRFIAIDYRGVDGKNGPFDWSDQIDALVTTLALPRFHLLGTAAGGGAAFQYALAFESKLRSLVVANSHGNVTDRDYVDMGRRMRPAPQFDQLPLEFRELGPSYRAADPDGVARWLALSAANPGAEAAARARAAGELAGPQPPGAARFALSPERAVTWRKLEKLKLPTLIVTGDADLYMPPSVLRMFVAHLQGAQSAVIPESGHSSYWENPEPFNRAVLEFVAKH